MVSVETVVDQVATVPIVPLELVVDRVDTVPAKIVVKCVVIEPIKH